MMNTLPPDGPAPEKPASPAPRPGWEPDTLTTVALCLVIAAAAWYLLRELAPLLRPLLLAVLLCYVILPTHLLLRRRMPGLVAVVVLAGVSMVGLYLLALMLYGSAVELSQDLPHWIERGRTAIQRSRTFLAEALPWVADSTPTATPAEARGADWLNSMVNSVAGVAADVLGESLVVGFYLLFLLLEVRRLPERVRGGFTGPQADEILAVVANINQAMASYLKVKVKASVVLAVPVTVVLWALGVKFPVMWGILTFVLNFIPYVGSIFACGLPILLAFLQMDLGWRPVAVAVLVITIHMLSAYVVEPSMTGRAVGLSPLVILMSLAFWYLCWGLIGMVLAVPLTVMLKIILENIAFTRPLARLMGEE